MVDTQKRPPRRVLLPSAVVLASVVFNGSASQAVTPTLIVPVPQAEVKVVAVPSTTPTVDVILEPPPVRAAATLPPRRQPEPRPGAEAQSQPKPPPPVTRHSTTGVASWYCGHGSRCTRGHPSGLYAAIRRDLLSLRGRFVTVSSGGRSVRVQIIDCNCGSHANLIDLYSDAFERLAPLSKGRIKVTIRW